MTRRYKNKKLSGIISFVLALVLFVGSIIGITAIANKKTKSVGSTAFKVGGINDNGEYVKTDTSIYTKDYIECQGLTIEPTFEAIGEYRVFYYDAEKQFMGATETMNASSGSYSKNDTYRFAKYCRIMITPFSADENGINKERN